MNETRIEELLRKAPRVVAPRGLEEQLKAGIRLTRSEKQSYESPVTMWIKRLVPISACALAISAVAIQGVILHQLKSENEKLHSLMQEVESSRVANEEELSRLQSFFPELERLRKEHQELQQLRLETEKMRGDVAGLEQLRADNFHLKKEQAIVNTSTNMDFFAQQKTEADSMACVNNLKQLGLGARLWTQDNENRPDAIKGQYPKTFSQFKNEVGNPRVFICPVEGEKQMNAIWDDIDQGRSSYVYVSPGASEMEPEVVVFRCPHHGHVALADGSVQREVLKRNYRIGKDNKLERK
jgi:hypothetical protein